MLYYNTNVHAIHPCPTPCRRSSKKVAPVPRNSILPRPVRAPALPAAILALILAVPGTAGAQHAHGHDGHQHDPDKPFWGDVTFELRNDWAARSNDPDEKGNDTFLEVEAALAARLAPGLVAHSHLKFEPVRDRGPGQDRFFGDHGLYVEALYLEYEEHDRFALRGGKFGQKFGTAWYAAPGIWGTDLAEDYEIAEQIGFAVDVFFGSDDAGSHIFTAGAFFADTSVLSQSAITNRGRTRKSDGGAGNTESFSSYALALEGGGFAILPGLGYHLAYLSRGTDVPGDKRETGIAAALSYEFKVGDVEVVPLVEWVRLNDADGTPGTDETYLTTAAAFYWGPWNLALARTEKTTKSPGAPDDNDRQSQISAGYAFENGINLNLGYLRTREPGVKTDTYGLMADYTITF